MKNVSHVVQIAEAEEKARRLKMEVQNYKNLLESQFHRFKGTLDNEKNSIVKNQELLKSKVLQSSPEHVLNTKQLISLKTNDLNEQRRINERKPMLEEKCLFPSGKRTSA